MANMFERISAVVVDALYAYLAAGAVFAVAFVFRGVQKVDSQADGSGWGFRTLIFPGSLAFWPLLLSRWISGKPAPEERNPHR
jgi:hypothetical protein